MTTDKLDIESAELLRALNAHYRLNMSGIELLREGGNATYAVHAGQSKYFLKCAGAAFFDTIKTSVAVNLFLQQKGFPVPSVILTADDEKPFVLYKDKCLILYEFLDTVEIDMDKDAEAVGALIGKLHRLMDDYPGLLIKRDKRYYIDRYIEILQKKRYPRAAEFASFGQRLWDRVEKLPCGFSHGDMYCGNIECCADGKLYILDLDTSCIGFSSYDLALICNRTDYFNYDVTGLAKTLAIFRRLFPEYKKISSLAECSERSLCDLLALYHFALQATIIEIYGIDCVDNAFFDNQFNWLKQWERQCDDEVGKITCLR